MVLCKNQGWNQLFETYILQTDLSPHLRGEDLEGARAGGITYFTENASNWGLQSDVPIWETDENPAQVFGASLAFSTWWIVHLRILI